MLDISKIKSKRDGNFIMLQVKGNTIQGIWKRQHGYTSDTFNRVYFTIKEAKQHTAKLLIENHFGSIFRDMFIEANSKK